MLKRRTFLIIAVMMSAPLAGRLVRPGLAQSADGRASAFVKSVGDKLVAVVNSSDSVSEKRSKLTTIIDGAVDVDGVARFCLGRFWRNASANQQQQFTELFHQVLVHNITVKLGEYRGVSFTMGRTRQHEENAAVSTVVERPYHPPTNVDWIIANSSGNPKIVDVIAEGTSLRLTQRQDYASYLTRNNNSIDALINAMRQQLAQSG